MELLNISIHHNERWPRQGIMFVPTFLLEEGDVIECIWKPKEQGKSLSIVIEQTDYKAEYSRNSKQIANLDIKSRVDFKIKEKGLYNFPIENPKSYSEGEIGQLIINLDSENNFNPFPERFYEYSKPRLIEGVTIKKCKRWGYRTDIGANILKDCNASGKGSVIFNSKENGFHHINLMDDKIKKTIFFQADKNEKITFEVSPINQKNFNINSTINKHNAVGFRGKLNSCQYFIANESGIYKFESEIHEFDGSSKKTIPEDFIEVKIYSNNHQIQRDFLDKYELKEVYNTVFNELEIEPIKKTVANIG